MAEMNRPLPACSLGLNEGGQGLIWFGSDLIGDTREMIPALGR
jgi:hypothetical protein